MTAVSLAVPGPATKMSIAPSGWQAKLPVTLTLTCLQACHHLQLIHDPSRKRASPAAWDCLLGYRRRIVNFHCLLWCVPLARDIRPIHKFDQRCLCRTFLGVGRYLHVRFSPSYAQVTYFLSGPDPLRSHRRRGFSNRAIAAMFAVTVINFLVFSLYVGTKVATFITLFLRKALILDIDDPPLSEKGKLVHNALQHWHIILLWSEGLPVRNNLSLLDSASFHARWRSSSAISL